MPGISRREFLKKVGRGFAGAAVGGALMRGSARAQATNEITSHKVGKDFAKNIQDIEKLHAKHNFDVILVKEGRWPGHDPEKYDNEDKVRDRIEEWHKTIGSAGGFKHFKLLQASMDIAKKDVDNTDPANHHQLTHFGAAVNHNLRLVFARDADKPEKELAKAAEDLGANKLKVLKLIPR